MRHRLLPHEEVEGILTHKATGESWAMQYHGKIKCKYCGKRMYLSQIGDPCPERGEKA